MKFTLTRVDQPLTQTTYRNARLKHKARGRKIRYSEEKRASRRIEIRKGSPLCLYSIATVSNGHGNWRAKTRPGRWFER